MNIQKSVISDTNTLLFQGDPQFQAVFDKLSPNSFPLDSFLKNRVCFPLSERGGKGKSGSMTFLGNMMAAAQESSQGS